MSVKEAMSDPRSYKRILIELVMFGLIIGLSCRGMPQHKQSDVKDLIQQLGADDWQIREMAHKELTKLGEKLIEQYRSAKSKRQDHKSDLELRTRYSELNKLAQALRQEYQDKDSEIRMRTNHIRDHFYVLTKPKIAFVSTQDAHEEIYVMDTDGSNQKKLTENQSYNGSPVWSPDGTRITFVSKRDGNYEIYLMAADGQNQKRLTKNQIKNILPVWSPDGTRIAFVSKRDGNYEIYLMDANGQNQTRLTQTQPDKPTEACSPNPDRIDKSNLVWSPDGTTIIFKYGPILEDETRLRFNSKIYKVNIVDKNLQRLTENQISDAFPAWSPDGTKIAFVSKRDGNPDIYLMDTSGKSQIRLTQNKSDKRELVWSPDGTKIAFVSDQDGNSDIYILDADGKNLKNLTQNKLSNFSPTWSPDGTKIAFHSHWNGFPEIYVMDVDGKNQQRLTENHSWSGMSVWNPSLIPEISTLFVSEPEEK